MASGVTALSSIVANGHQVLPTFPPPSLIIPYDNIGQLKKARGWEPDGQGGQTPRLHEQFGYAYDAAWNLNYRTNNALVQTFGVNNLNELTTAGLSGTLTVAGTAGERRGSSQSDPGVTWVTVSGTGLSSGAAELHADGAWSRA